MVTHTKVTISSLDTVSDPQNSRLFSSLQLKLPLAYKTFSSNTYIIYNFSSKTEITKFFKKLR